MGITGRSSAVAALLLVAVSTLSAQQFNGTWSVRGANATVTVTMQQDAQGNIRGTWTGNGTMQIEGMVEEGVAVGAIYDEQGGVYFEAQLQGSDLLLALIEVGADNQPDYSKMTNLTLASQAGGGAAMPPAGAPGGNPMAGGAGNPLAAGGADPLAGTYDGDGVRLLLEPGQGGYRGSLTVQGQSFPVAAAGSGGQVRGTFTASGQQYEFQAQLNGAELTLVSGGSTYRLSKQGEGAAANPLAGAAAVQPAASGTSALLGPWSCQTVEGPAQLHFRSQTELVYNGESTSYQVTGNVIRVPGDWGPVDYRYQLQGDRLSITGPDGSTSQCQRQQGGQAAGGAVGGGSGLEGRLQGKLCSYSSSPDGGYSTQHLLQFNGQGRFWYGIETAWDIPSTTGVSRNWDNGENVGGYQVTGANRGDAVHLRFADGRVGTARVYHVYQGQITELFLEGPDRHYGKSLCP